MLCGLSATADVPIPDRATACERSPAASVNRRLVVLDPIARGAKLTATLQASPLESVAPLHVSALVEKVAGWPPTSVTCPSVTASAARFVSVTVRGALAVATGCDPKSMLWGEATVPGANLTTRWLPLSLT